MQRNDVRMLPHSVQDLGFPQQPRNDDVDLGADEQGDALSADDLHRKFLSDGQWTRRAAQRTAVYGAIATLAKKLVDDEERVSVTKGCLCLLRHRAHVKLTRPRRRAGAVQRRDCDPCGHLGALLVRGRLLRGRMQDPLCPCQCGQGGGAAGGRPIRRDWRVGILTDLRSKRARAPGAANGWCLPRAVTRWGPRDKLVAGACGGRSPSIGGSVPWIPSPRPRRWRATKRRLEIASFGKTAIDTASRGGGVGMPLRSIAILETSRPR
mmetsp:Transcript_147022/g.382129  ORF Transcript_147022/g.382129 Transcript_147022/m.382129 type:complete len:266 (-) Transcript_147022:1177-1974(-)